MYGVKSTKGTTGRIFAGVVHGGPSKGFSDENLKIEMLDAAAPVKVWRPSESTSNNLNGSYPNLNCYTIPASCKASNEDKLEKGD